MDNRGFTLVELIVTIVLLGLIASIGSFTIINVLEDSKEENYQLLIDNIKTASETYYQECKYAFNDSISTICNNEYKVTLGELVEYGYLKGNKTNDDGSFAIVNPNDDKNISDCLIHVGYVNGKISVSAVGATGSCPTTENYNE